MNHTETGKRLRAINEYLVHLSVEAYNAKGRARKASVKISKAITLLQDARSELEVEMFLENPGAAIGTYFGPADAEVGA